MAARIRLFALAGPLLAASAAVAPAPAVAGFDAPLARFEEGVCPGVAGLQVEQAETMVGMIRANAAALGLELQDEAVCDPNLVVSFVEDGRSHIARLLAQPHLAAEYDVRERRRLRDQPGPVRTFMRIRTLSRDGMPLSQRQSLADPPQTTMWSAHSKIYTAIRTDIHSALVLVDKDAVGSMGLRQLADYASFRALSPVRPDRLAAGESILTLFDGGGPAPAGLTEMDRRFLATLYANIPNLPSSTRLANLEQSTGREAVQH